VLIRPRISVVLRTGQGALALSALSIYISHFNRAISSHRSSAQACKSVGTMSSILPMPPSDIHANAFLSYMPRLPWRGTHWLQTNSVPTLDKSTAAAIHEWISTSRCIYGQGGRDAPLLLRGRCWRTEGSGLVCNIPRSCVLVLVLGEVSVDRRQLLGHRRSQLRIVV
jgi:hypothetical protein